MNVLDRMDPGKLGERLRDARSAAGLTQHEVAKMLGISRTTLVAMEQGQRRVRPDELRGLAEAYRIGINDLLRQTAVSLDLSAKFRLASSVATSDEPALDAIRLLNRLVASTLELEERLGRRREYQYAPPKAIMPGDVTAQAEDMALTFRHRLGLGLAPIPDMLSLLEFELQVRVYLRPLHSSVCGLFAFSPESGACMLINSNHPPERQVQTAAHETGHFETCRELPDVLHSDAVVQSREERFAATFASAVLMPAAAIRTRFYEMCDSAGRFSPRSLIMLAQRFHVSVEAMSRRLEGLRLLPQGTFDSLRDRGFAVDAAKRAMGLEDPKREVATPPRLIALAVDAYRQGLYSEGQLCDMLEMGRAELRNFLEMVEDIELDEPITVEA